MHLVPFGEFVPFRKALFFIEKLVEIVGDFGLGQRATVFNVNDYRFGVSICYEIIFPDLVRQPVKNGAEYLVNITNDAWFGKKCGIVSTYLHGVFTRGGESDAYCARRQHRYQRNHRRDR